MIKILSTLTAVSAGILLLSGCASPSMSGSTYSHGQAQREMTVRMGVVDNVRPVTIDGTKTGTGTAAGGLIGGAAGSNVGGGNKGSAVGAVLGAVGGAVAGHMLEERVTRRPGLEITVKFDNGSMSAITQEADEEFKVGDRVRVLSGSGSTRVTH